MARMTPQQVYDTARNAGFSPDLARRMTAIAQRESSLDPTVVGRLANRETSYGLWQINFADPGVRRLLNSIGITSGEQLLDPATNARAAYALYGGSERNLNTAWYIDQNRWVTLASGERVFIPYRDRYLENLSRLPANMENPGQGPGGGSNQNVEAGGGIDVGGGFDGSLDNFDPALAEPGLWPDGNTLLFLGAVTLALVVVLSGGSTTEDAY